MEPRLKAWAREDYQPRARLRQELSRSRQQMGLNSVCEISYLWEAERKSCLRSGGHWCNSRIFRATECSQQKHRSHAMTPGKARMISASVHVMQTSISFASWTMLLGVWYGNLTALWAHLDRPEYRRLHDNMHNRASWAVHKPPIILSETVKECKLCTWPRSDRKPKSSLHLLLKFVLDEASITKEFFKLLGATATNLYALKSLLGGLWA